jgi:hypothetical protein
MPPPLKLRAGDKEDLAVIAALLQDALAPISDMVYLPEEKRFILVLNRFRWEAAVDPAAPADEPSGGTAPARDAPFEEDETEPKPYFERVHCGVCFDRVAAVHMKGIDPRARDRILELLTIQAEDGAVLLVFAGDAAVRLTVEGLQCRLEDLDEAWPTRWRPQHAVEDDENG